MTATLMIVYPADPSARFDAKYYAECHLPLIRNAWKDGLERAYAHLGVAGLDGSPPAYAAVTLLRFTSVAAMEAALSGVHAPQVMGDVANFTTITPVAQTISAL